MIELTQEQRRELEGPEPVHVRDPQTNETYVLVKASLYERVRDLLKGPTGTANDLEVPPGIRRSEEAFLRDLPRLLARRKYDHCWAAYRGDEQIGIARQPQRLLREIVRRGIPPDAYYLGIIRSHEPEPEEVEPRHAHHFGDLEPAS